MIFEVLWSNPLKCVLYKQIYRIHKNPLGVAGKALKNAIIWKVKFAMQNDAVTDHIVLEETTNQESDVGCDHRILHVTTCRLQRCNHTTSHLLRRRIRLDYGKRFSKAVFIQTTSRAAIHAKLATDPHLLQGPCQKISKNSSLVCEKSERVRWKYIACHICGVCQLLRPV